ncbi:InlB B-repeat-containing protein [Candidatus Saccharibacteria bacterium]|nr:InlB B-repeat-containing protein [Candidatus Saccharibacteria bacterium]
MKKRFLMIVSVSLFALVVAAVFGVIAPEQVYAKYTTKTTQTIKISVEKAHYTVRFHANADDDPVVGTMEDQVFTYGEPQALTLNAFERSGYIFDRWNTKASGLGIDYEDGATINLDKENGAIVNLYAQWEEDDEMHTEFEMDGVCIFHGYEIQQGGDGHITGNNCIVNGINWADGTHRYIDTGVSLYNEENYGKDFEIGFTILEYDPDHQFHNAVIDEDNGTQSTFVNAKLEDSSRNWPGLAIRKNGDKIDVVQTINDGGTFDKQTRSHSAATTTKVVVTRVDGVVYYSFNDEPFEVLQDMNGTSDYFDTTVWFGAAERSDGAPKRYLDATLSNLYIKVGETGANKHTVSFNAGGVTEDPNNVTVIGSAQIGSLLPEMPNSVETDSGRKYFGGWYTEQDGAGQRITEESMVNQDMTLYAFWRDNNNICRVGGTTYPLLQDCIDEAGVGDTITLLDNIKDHVLVDTGVEITLDLNGYKFSDNGGGDPVVGSKVIDNKGKLTIINGTITSSLAEGVVNNESGAELYIQNGARIVATGSKQAVYNNGGRLVISDNAYLSASSSSRAALHNLNNGSVTITGGTIISTKQVAVENASGTLVIGVSGGGIVNSTPIMRGATYGVRTTPAIEFYDGILQGKTAAINNENLITAEEGATKVNGTAVISGVTYQTLHYEFEQNEP